MLPKFEWMGILNTPGISSVQFGGAATYASILAFENALATANADQPGAKFGYLTSPSARNKLKGAAVALTGATTVSARPIWDAGNFSDPSDGVVNGYRAASTNQVLNNQMFFGDWSQVLVCLFGSGLDVVSDIYTQAATGEVKLTLSAYMDIAVLHAQSFCVSADSAAQ
jgi:HK97 family phage major capsid protein